MRDMQALKQSSKGCISDIEAPIQTPHESVPVTDTIKARLLTNIAGSFAKYGCPTHRLEYHTESISETMHISSSVFVLPSMILFSTNDTTSMIKVNTGCDLSKLSAVNAVCREIEQSQIDANEAIEKIEAIKRQVYNPLSWNGLSGSPTNTVYMIDLVIPVMSARFVMSLIKFMLCRVQWNMD